MFYCTYWSCDFTLSRLICSWSWLQLELVVWLVFPWMSVYKQMYRLMSESVPETYLTVMGSKLLGLQGWVTAAGRDPHPHTLDGQLDGPHQGWPSGHSHFTGEEVRVEFQCHAGVNLATTLLNPCPPHPCLPHHQYPLCPNISLTPFPSPIEF